jgi:cyanophycin synthetase
MPIILLDMLLSGALSTTGLARQLGSSGDQDLIELGKLSATFFDRIIVKEDDDNRGRPWGDTAELIVQGIEQVVTETPVPHTIILNESEAISWALDNAPDNGLVAIFPDNVSRAIELIMARNPISDPPEASILVELTSDNSPKLDPVSVSNNGSHRSLI